MEILYILIPLSLMLLIVAVAVFFWAVGAGQFDDLDSPAYRILMDDDTQPERGQGDGPGSGAGARDACGTDQERDER